MATQETILEKSGGKTIDPVCRMTVDPESTKLFSIYRGCKYYFCAQGCLKSFEADPEKYLKPRPAKKKGWFGRYLERMARVNEKEFGSHRPSCCH